MFASRTTKTIEVPLALNEPGDTRQHEVTIQKLAGRHLAKAQQAHFNEIVANIAARGGARVQREIEELWKKPDAVAQVEEVQADPLSGFDPYTLIAHGVTGWTFDIPVGPAAFENLDEEAVDFLARAVLKLTKPGLFHTQEEAKATQKETHADPSFA